jgi:type I restriction enzyme S subunit
VPEGWAAVQLGELVTNSRERVDPADRPSDPYLSLEHIESGTGRILGRGQGADVRSTKTAFQAIDVLYGRLRPYLNKVCIPGFNGICSTDILVLRPSPAVDARFLLIVLRHPELVEFASHNMTGDLPRISYDKLASFRLRLPPLAEQQRIVRKVRQLSAPLISAAASLAKASSLLASYYESIYVAACSGLLTADWREETTVVESGASLLARIGAKGTRGDAFSSSTARAIPRTWAWTTMGQLARLVTSGSRGWAKYYSEQGALFIRAQDISSDQLRLDEVAHVSLPENAEGTRTRVKRGDLLITITGANVTKTALVDVDLDEAYVSQHVALVRPLVDEIQEYLWLWTVSPSHGRAQLSRAAYGSGKPGLNLDSIRGIDVALPPVVEQLQIVRRAKEHLAVAKRVEDATSVSRGRTESSLGIIYTRALQGELVPTEAEVARLERRPYQSAQQLLGTTRQEAEERARTAAVERRGRGMAGRTTRRRATSRPDGRASLLSCLTDAGHRLTPEQLFTQAGFDDDSVEEFYKELREAVRANRIREIRPNDTEVFLEMRSL